MNLPANIPAANFWSVTLYEAENGSGLATGQPFPAIGSRDKLQQNADRSTDLYLGPKAPEGKAGNWLATVPGKGYFAILRLYGPTEAAINKELETWGHREGEDPVTIATRSSSVLEGESFHDSSLAIGVSLVILSMRRHRFSGPCAMGLVGAQDHFCFRFHLGALEEILVHPAM